jgi:ribosomal-protein-alanine N-acetyltransferase
MKTPEETLRHIEEMRKREAAGTHVYASILIEETKELIGTAMLFNFDLEARHAEIGYVLHPDHWGKGYGTEAISMMDAFAFDILHLHKLHAQVVEANTGSLRVLEKNDYHLEGRLLDYYHIDGRYHDALLLGRFNPEERIIPRKES